MCVLTTRKFKVRKGARASLINGRTKMQFAWKPTYASTFHWIKDRVKCLMVFLTIIWMCSRLQPAYIPNQTTLNSVIINPELAILPENLRYVWTAT
jgi:hypothetical protein